MVRILGTNLLNRKYIYIALTDIYGIGISRSLEILNKTSINPKTKVSDLTEENISKIRDLLENENYKLEGDLKRLIGLNIKRLIDINSVRGRRHLKGLPVRGQRTKTNSRTSRRIGLFTKKIK
jgi:small subunit ribosomal protein S13